MPSCRHPEQQQQEQASGLGEWAGVRMLHHTHGLPLPPCGHQRRAAPQPQPGEPACLCCPRGGLRAALETCQAGEKGWAARGSIAASADCLELVLSRGGAG